MKKAYFHLMLVILSCMVSVQGWAANVTLNGTELKSGVVYTNSNRSTAIKSGSILYDAVAKTLTLDNLISQDNIDRGLYIYDNVSLTIILKGYNTITTTGSGIDMGTSRTNTDQYLNIISDGTGSLYLSASLEGIISYAGSILIKDCTLSAKGKYGIKGYNNGSGSETVDLTINNATVHAQGSVSSGYEYGSITALKSLKLKNCEITFPEQIVSFGKTYRSPTWAIVYINSQNESAAYPGKVVIEPATKKLTKPDNCLSFTSQESNTRISFKKVGGYPYNPAFVYSKNGEDWYDYDLDEEIALPDDETPVYLMSVDKSNTGFSSASDNYVHFESTGKVKAAGNIMTLLDKTGEKTNAPYRAFVKMFLDCTNLLQAPELPATTLDRDCYDSMFQGCTNLTTAPALPAMALEAYCYAKMFQGCTSLTKAPSLPATTLADCCYSHMFDGCTSLKSAPALPATTLDEYCYSNMFNGCSSLTTAPKLPATTLANGCYYQMFYQCTSLQIAPTLPAEQLVGYCYYQMFFGCTKLVGLTARFSDWNEEGRSTYNWLSYAKSGGVLLCPDALDTETRSSSTVPESWYVRRIKLFKKPADCFQFIPRRLTATIKFEKVGSAPSVKLLYSYDGYEWYNYSLDQAVQVGASADERTVYFIAEDKNETFAIDIYNRVHIAIDSPGPNLIATGNIMYLLDRTGKQNSVPDNCFYKLFSDNTYLLTPPALPATTLGQSCYAYMFANDTNISQAPELPAQTLNTYSYSHMFEGCSNLSKVTVGFTDWPVTSTQYWLSGVASTGTFVCPSGLVEKRGESAIPTGWTIERVSSVVDIAKLIKQLNLPSSTVTIDDVNTLIDKVLKK